MWLSDSSRLAGSMAAGGEAGEEVEAGDESEGWREGGEVMPFSTTAEAYVGEGKTALADVPGTGSVESFEALDGGKAYVCSDVSRGK